MLGKEKGRNENSKIWWCREKKHGALSYLKFPAAERWACPIPPESNLPRGYSLHYPHIAICITIFLKRSKIISYILKNPILPFLFFNGFQNLLKKKNQRNGIRNNPRHPFIYE